MINKFRFDWDIVAKIDPSYKQYLVDITNTEPEETFSGAEIELTPIRRQPIENDEILPELSFRRKNLSDDELAIIKALHDTQNKEQDEHSIIKDMTINADATLAESTSHYALKPEYTNYPYVKTTTVPLLPPPKRVLDCNSHMWKGYDVYYSTGHASERNPDVITLTKQKFYYNHPKVGMFKTLYRFDRIKDVSSEIRRHYKMVVYNLDTAKFYYITNQSPAKNKKAIRVVHQISLNIDGIIACLSICNSTIKQRFMDTIMNHICKLIPDAVIPPPPKPRKRRTAQRIGININTLSKVELHQYQMEKFFSLFLQHKVGQRLEWANDQKFLAKVGKMSAFCTMGQSRKWIENMKKKCLYRIIPNLRKNPSAKTITKTFFKYGYRNIVHKLFINHKDALDSIRKMASLTATIDQGLLPKSTYHLIVYLVKTDSEYSATQLYRILEAVESIHFRQQTGVGNDTRTLELYTRTIQNFIKNDVRQVIGWSMFRDMMDMATELNIRVRINKFQCSNDIAYLHDRLVGYQQRDLQAFNKYNNFEFLEFESPDKKYGGFKFIQLLRPADLVKEGKNMRHCVGGYSNQCLNGNSIIFSMFKERSWVTIELNGADQTYPITQMYTIKDFTVNNEIMLGLIEQWRSEVEDMHRNDDTPYSVKAHAYYEYQKNQIRLLELQKILLDELEPDEQKLVQNRIRDIEQRLEDNQISLDLSEEIDYAPTYEQAVA